MADAPQDLDPDGIAREVAVRRREKELLTAWGSKIEPESSWSFAINADDNWLDDLE